MSRSIDIFINSKGNLAAAENAKKTVDELRSSLMSVGTISLGVGFERAFEGVKERLREAIKESIAFNAELETTKYSLAAVLKQNSPGKYSDFNGALRDSANLMEIIRKKSNEMSLDYVATLEAYKTTAGAMFAGGVRDLQKQVDLTIMLNQAMAGMGVSGFMAQRDIQDILTGRAHMTKAGRELGLDDNEIKKAEQAGKLYEFLNEKLGSYAEAGKAAAGTLNSEMNRFHNTLQQIEGELGKPMFEEIKQGIKEVTDLLNNHSLQHALAPLADAAKDSAHMFFVATKFTIDHAGAIKKVTEVLAGLVAVSLTWKGLNFSYGLALQTAKWGTEAAAIKDVTAALMANTAAKEANAAAGERVWKNQYGTWASRGKAAGAAAEGAASLGVGNILQAGTMAAVTGWSIGTALDAKGITPLRWLMRQIRGEGASSSIDQEKAAVRREQYDADFKDFGDRMTNLSSLKERDKLVEEYQEKISGLAAAEANAGWEERDVIRQQIQSWESLLNMARSVTQARLDHTAAVKQETAALQDALELARRSKEIFADSRTKLDEVAEGTAPGMAHAKAKKQLEDAKQNTGVTDFSDADALKKNIEPWMKRGAEINRALSAADKYKDDLAKAKDAAEQAGHRYGGAVAHKMSDSVVDEAEKKYLDAVKKQSELEKAGAPMTDAEEQELRRELGVLARNVKNYSDWVAKGAAAQQKVHDNQLKLTEAQDKQALDEAIAKKDYARVKQLQEKALYDKRLEEYSRLPISKEEAKKMAQSDVVISREQNQRELDKLRNDIKVAELRKKGKNREADAIEGAALAQEYESKYGIGEKEASELAAAQMKNRRNESAFDRPDADRFTKIGLFTGVGVAGDPVISIHRESNTLLKAILDQLKKTGPGESRPVVN